MHATARASAAPVRERSAAEPAAAPRRPRAAPAGLVAQCVGGHKYGLERTADPAAPGASPDIATGLALLREVDAAYKAEISHAKAAAIADFDSGDRSDLDRQSTYTAALAAAERTPAGLRQRLVARDPLFTFAGAVIRYNGQAIANLHAGNAAYVVHAPALSAAHSAVYRRHSLDGLAAPGAKDYVHLGGAYVRRFANRGITPPERTSFLRGEDLVPLNAHRRTTGQAGYGFHHVTGATVPRDDNPDSNDLSWFNTHAGTALPAFPNSDHLFAFLQTRKGVNKAFSATSTPRAITSNHGASFADHGAFELDLARVPSANVLHHYKQPGFTQGGIGATLPPGTAISRPGVIDWETDRANESVLRNRELVLSSIPHAAVIHPELRAQYEGLFRLNYADEFPRRYAAELATHGFEDEPAPAPVYPAYAPVSQIPALATAAAQALLAPRVAFCAAYQAAYAQAWIAAYYERAEALHPDGDLDYSEVGAATKNPPVPENADIPYAPGANPQATGGAAGRSDGTDAANAFYRPPQAAHARTDSDSEDSSSDSDDDSGASSSAPRGKGRGGKKAAKAKGPKSKGGGGKGGNSGKKGNGRPGKK